MKQSNYFKTFSVHGLLVVATNVLLVVFAIAKLSTEYAAAAVNFEPVSRVLSDASDPMGIALKWKTVMNMINLLVIVVLIVMAFAQILRLKVDTYGVKKILPSLVLAIIAANFSFLICRLIIDLANVSVSLLVNPMQEVTGGNKLKDLTNGIQLVGSFDQLVSSSLILGLFKLILMLIGAVMIYILAYLFIIRNWVIYFLVVLSPLAFMANVIPQGKSIFNQWWSNYIKWVFMPVVSIFWLWLGSLWANTGSLGTATGDQGSYLKLLFTVVCFYLAITTPYKMGGAVMSQWGNLGKKVWGGTAGAAKRKWIDPRIEELKNNAKEWYLHTASKGASNQMIENRREAARATLKKISPRLKELEEKRKNGIDLLQEEQDELETLRAYRTESEKNANYSESASDKIIGQTLGRFVRRTYRAKDRQEDAKKAVEGAENTAYREALGGKFGQFLSEDKQMAIAARKNAIDSDFGEREWIYKHLDGMWKTKRDEGKVAVMRSLAYQYRMEAAENLGKIAANAAKATANLETKDNKINRINSEIEALRKREENGDLSPAERSQLEKLMAAREKAIAKYRELESKLAEFDASRDGGLLLKRLSSNAVKTKEEKTLINTLQQRRSELENNLSKSDQEIRENTKEISRLKERAPLTEEEIQERDRLIKERNRLLAAPPSQIELNEYKDNPVFGAEWTEMYNHALTTRNKATDTEMAAKKAEGDAISENALMSGKMQMLLTAFKDAGSELSKINKNIEVLSKKTDRSYEQDRQLEELRSKSAQLEQSRNTLSKDWDQLRKRLLNNYYDEKRGKFIGPSIALQEFLTDENGNINRDMTIDQARSTVDNLPAAARQMVIDRMGKRYSSLFNEERQSTAGKREAQESLDLLQEWLADPVRGEAVRKYLSGDRLSLDPVFERKIDAEITNAIAKSADNYPIIMGKLNENLADIAVGGTALSSGAKQTMFTEVNRVFKLGAQRILDEVMQEAVEATAEEGGDNFKNLSESRKREIREQVYQRVKTDDDFRASMEKQMQAAYVDRFGLTTGNQPTMVATSINKDNGLAKVDFTEGQNVALADQITAAQEVIIKSLFSNIRDQRMSMFRQGASGMREAIYPPVKEPHKGIEDTVVKKMGITNFNS